MRNLIFLFTALILGTTGSKAASTEDKVATSNSYGNTNSFIFVENGITFSVYPDGEFDFYINNRNSVNASVNFGHTNITFNSGYDYNPYVQYDDYGAVIQIENVPIYYDYYGRVTQIGDVNINYNSGRVSRVGGLYVYYNNRGLYSHHRGFINVYNRHYVYSPFHSYFVRPALGFSLVFGSPYRRYYTPVRYTYYRPYVHNHRKAYAKIGHYYKYDKGHHNTRSTIYRNDKRVTVRDNGLRANNLRSNRSVANSSKGLRNNNTVSRTTTQRSNVNGNSTVKRSTTVRSSSPSANTNNSVSRSATVRPNDKSNVQRTVSRTTTTRNSNGSGSSVTKSKAVVSGPSGNARTVVKKEVNTSPRNTTISRSSSTRSNSSSSVRNSTVKRPTVQSGRSVTKSASSSARQVSTTSSRGRSARSN
jgi:hypothetical protein